MGILNHFNDKFGMVTVLDGTFYDTKTGKPLVEFDTLTVSNITAEGEEKEIRGGQGADLLMQYDYGRTANIELTDALLSMESLSFLWGSDAPSTDFEYLGKARFKGDNAPEILNDVETDINKVVIIDASGEATEFEGIEGDLPEYSAEEEYIVYYTATSATGNQLTLTSRDFPPVVHFVGQTFVIDKLSGKRKIMQIDVPRLKLGSDFEFTLEAEGDASTFDFSGVALAHRGDIMKFQDLGFIDED